MNTSSKPEDAVGYGRPPKHSQWKKGQSGNTKQRRKRRPKSVATMVDEFLERKVDVVENGLSLRRTAFETIFLQLYNKAITGNTRALNVLKKYGDFAASRDRTGGLRVVLIEEHERSKLIEEYQRSKALGEKNG